MCKTGHCIICHKNDRPLSDEHLIPEAIGGYYHIYSVCKDCNSNLGFSVDKYLLDHWFIKGVRHEKKLKGYSGAIPNPLIGEGSLSSGERIKISQTKEGELEIKFIPQPPVISQSVNSSHIEFAVDENDSKLIPQIQKKILERNNIDYSTHKIVTKTSHVKLEHPEVKMEFSIDLHSYKIGLLKIAYEFAVDRISRYENDEIAQLYSQILKDGSIDRLSQVFFIGDAIQNSHVSILNRYIDNSNNNRHILFLFNRSDGLYCFVKLFDKFCQLIKMSDFQYNEIEEFTLAINDLSKKNCEIINPKELIKRTCLEESTSFKLTDEGNSALNSVINSHNEGSVGFACNKFNDNILYDTKSNPICTQEQLLLTLEKLNWTKNEIAKEEKISVTYIVPKGFHYMIKPSDKLVEIVEITKETTFSKI